MTLLCKSIINESENQLWRPKIRHHCPAPENAIILECSSEVVLHFIGKMVYYYCNHNDLNINTIRAIITMHVHFVILFQRLPSTVLHSIISRAARRKAGSTLSLWQTAKLRRGSRGRAGHGRTGTIRLEHHELILPTNVCMCSHTPSPQARIPVFTGNVSGWKYQNRAMNWMEKQCGMSAAGAVL